MNVPIIQGTNGRRLLALSLATLGLALTLTVVPGVFTIDENNYLATLVGLREPGFGLPGTAKLPPSLELYWFDPFPRFRGEPKSPVVSAAPPLYAPLAAPFSLLGWRGLVALNTLAFLVATLLVFLTAARHAARPSTAWWAAGAFALGGFNLEYAQGIWPHMLAVALCTAGFHLAGRAREELALWPAAASGLCLGLACGVRYQNIAFAGLVGLGLVLWARRRVASSACFALGLAAVLAASAAINHARLGSWNPVSKGAGYASLGGLHAISAADPGHASLAAAVEPLAVLWAKVVDFSTHPPIAGEALGPVPKGAAASWGWAPDAMGAFIRHGAVKKAWVQSSPWVLLAFVVLAWAWRPGRALTAAAQREARAASLVVGGMLLVFGLAGFGRWDGLCFNQRYFLELVPLAAVGWAWGLERVSLERTPVLIGVLGGSALAAVCLLSDPGSAVRSALLLSAPIALAACLALSWTASGWRPAFARPTAGLVGACLVWSLAVHLGDDVAAARRLRAYSVEQTALYDQALPARAALIAFGPIKDAAGPLLLTRDLVIVDALIDAGADASSLVEAFFREGRPVFVDLARFPPEVFERVRRSRKVRVAVPGPDPIVELTRAD